MRRASMCGFRAFTCGAIPFLLFTLRVFCSALLFRPSVRVVLCPASLLPEFRSALFLLRPLARHLMPVVPFGGILPPFKFFYCADCQSVFFRFVHCAAFLNVHCAGYHLAFFSAPPQTTIRLPSGFPPFCHPFTSRRCTGELVPFGNMLDSLACSFFARIFSFLLLFLPPKFAYSKYFLYLCTRNEVRIDPK